MAGRRLSKKPKLDPIRSEINITPLVDVVLVMLIIFMVVSQQMKHGREVPNLPKTKFHSEEKDKKQPVVAIDDKGIVYFLNEELGPLTPAVEKDLAERIQRAWDSAQAEGQGRVYLKASGELPYEQVYPLIVALKDLPDVRFDIATADGGKK